MFKLPMFLLLLVSCYVLHAAPRGSFLKFITAAELAVLPEKKIKLEGKL